jgi:hypothetical protein
MGCAMRFDFGVCCLWALTLAMPLTAAVLPVGAHSEESRLRAAMNIELQILDPHITTAG